MTKLISLSDKQKAKQEAKLQDSYERRKTLTRATLTSYKKLYHIILRQTGKENYPGEPYDNPVGESLFYELLTADLEKIIFKLGSIVRTIEGELREK
ncbi:MAG: hypothetical protein PVJ67_00435 [Candidatus Pacearchaeota archaeon]|jgi:hypothetical protein